LHPSSDISEAALNISDLCSRTGVELPLRATTSTEPMTHTTSPQMSPSTRAVASPTEISFTSSSRSEIHQLPTSVYSVNDMPSCSTTNVRTENISSVTTEMPSYSTENSTEIASTQRQQYPQIASGTVEGANFSASGLPPKSFASQQSYPGNISISWKEKTCTWKWIFEQENHTKSARKRKINKRCSYYIFKEYFQCLNSLYE